MRTEPIEEYLTINEETSEITIEPDDSLQKYPKLTDLDPSKPVKKWNSKSSFVDGAAVGLGVGIMSAFGILWASLFFGPMLPQSATYETLLSVFIYPLYFLLGLGLVTITAGFVREYYSKTRL